MSDRSSPEDERSREDGPASPDGSASPDKAASSAEPAIEGWPVRLRGVTESIVATLGPNDRWNVAALGLHAPDEEGDAVTATTWGSTRTRGNFHRTGGGVIQFTNDPREFVDAAATIREADEPVLPNADAYVEVEVESIETGQEGGTEFERWKLRPIEGTATVREARPRTINRGFGAVIDATVAASRLEVDAYDTAELVDRLRYFESVVERCGGPHEREAFDRLTEATDWPAYGDR